MEILLFLGNLIWKFSELEPDCKVCSGTPPVCTSNSSLQRTFTGKDIAGVLTKIPAICKNKELLTSKKKITFTLLASKSNETAGHHSILAQVCKNGKDDHNIRLVLHIVLNQDKVQLRIDDWSSASSDHLNETKLGEKMISVTEVVANAAACVEKFGDYSILTNNCRHYCQFLARNLGLYHVYSSKTACSSNPEPERIEKITKDILQAASAWA